MKWQGTIDFQKPIKINGKPHGVEHEATLPIWSSDYIGVVIHAEDTSKLWFGGSSAWLELTPGGVGVHDHNDVYYTEEEVDAFFEGESSGKKQVDFSNVINKPSLYNPTTHSNTSHSENYITSAAVTFETLQTNGDIGTAATQLAIGSHNHDLSYSPTGHTHTETDITDLDKYTQLQVDTLLLSKSDTTHDHSGVYEPVFTKNTAFNKDFGTVSDSVAEGDHEHGNITNDGKVGSTANLPLKTTTDGVVTTGSFGTTSGTFAEGNHNHDDRYYTESEVDTKFNEILIPSTSGAPSDSPTAGTVRFDASTNILYIYNGTSWVSTTLT